MEKSYKDHPVVFAKDRSSWRKWLMNNHAKQDKAWLVIHHKSSQIPSVYYADAVCEALCFGWIDSKPNKRDESSYYLYFAKRNPKSKWSKINKERVKVLLKDKLMQPAGLRAIQIAKANGQWNALNPIDKVIIPDDLKKALKAAKVDENFERFSVSAKRMILEWITSARTKETRIRRITETVSGAAENLRPKPFRAARKNTQARPSK